MSSFAATQDSHAGLPLAALLSQTLVAFTIEFDNEFERRMRDEGYAGARLSWVVWANLMRFLADGPVSVRDLASSALASARWIKLELGCLERWGFVVLHDPVQAPAAGTGQREGWGSGRGIRANSMSGLTAEGFAANRIWAPLTGIVERRWEKRFGREEIDNLRASLRAIVDALDMELPYGLPDYSGENLRFPARKTDSGRELSLPALLSQVLLAFRIEFDRESRAPLFLCANILRVLGETPVRLAEIPRLTGGSPETTALGWRVRPYVTVEPDPDAPRGKVVCLSPQGLQARQTYHRLLDEIETRWEERFGRHALFGLQKALQQLFERDNEDGPLISEGLVPPSGTARAGDLVPALGRKDVGSAAKQRLLDLVAQTRAFMSDPAGALPHYPLFDMNRGFGP
jgi:hypothetical protein